jgi:hypothetical protein
MRVMGQDLPAKQFREYLRVVRSLLDGKRSTTDTAAIPTKSNSFRDRYYINLDK